MKSAVVLFSGGMDSTACLAMARKMDYAHVAALLVDYGQPHRDAELYAAGQILQRLEVPATRICVADLFAILRPAERMMNAPHVSEGGQHPATVLLRNAQFVVSAAAHGLTWWPEDALDIYIGTCLDDAAGFVDATQQFIATASPFLTLGSGRNVHVRAPLQQVTKRQIVATADAELLALLRISWSCYRGGAQACGVCTPCVLRRDAFDAAGVQDGQFSWMMHGGDPHREAK